MGRPVGLLDADRSVDVVGINVTRIERRLRPVAQQALGRSEAAVLGNVGPHLVGHHPMVPQELETALLVLVVIKVRVANLKPNYPLIENRRYK